MALDLGVDLFGPKPEGGDAAEGLLSKLGEETAKSFKAIRAQGGRRKDRYASPKEEPPLSHIIFGEKDAGKSAFPLLFPAPKGTRTIIRTFDFTTERSIRETFGNQYIEENKIFFDAVLRPDPTSGYLGLDFTRPETAVDVYAECIAALENERDAGDVGRLVMDHFQQAYEKVCANLAYVIAGEDPMGGGLKFSDWRPRTEAAQALEQLSRSVPVYGGHDFITGYGATQKWSQEETGRMKHGKKEQVIVRKPKWPVWLGWDGEISRDRDLTWELGYFQEGDAGEGHRQGGTMYRGRHTATIFSSKLRSYPKGLTIDWTNRWTLADIQPQIDEALAAIEAARSQPPQPNGEQPLEAST